MNPPASIPNLPVYRYLALGDSYTIGESVSANERFPEILTDALRAQGIPMEAPLIIARTGWTTAQLSAAIDQANPQGTFDLVTLLIGVNNQYRAYGIGEYQVEFRSLLERSIAFAGGHPARVIVISIPDWGAAPFAAGRDELKIAEEIDAFNAVNRAGALEAGARYVNVTGISRLAMDDHTLIARDGLHPSEKMYALWVEKILPAALLALRK